VFQLYTEIKGVLQVAKKRVGNLRFLLIPSVGGIVTSIPFFITGSIRKGRVIRDFQRQHYLSQPSRQIQFNVYPNRVGIAYVF